MPEIVEGVGEVVHRFAGKPALITGASGVLPGYLADAVAYCNRHVFARPARLVLLVRTPPGPGSRLAHLVGRPDVEFLIQDARSPIEVDGTLHFIIHAASPATPRKFAEEPVSTVAENSGGQAQLREVGRQRETQGFPFFSSGASYGAPGPSH